MAAASNAPLEKDWQADVTAWATRLGWRWWHFHDSRRQVRGMYVGDKDAAGFPDLVLVHRELGLGFVELKRSKASKPTEKQLAAAAALAQGIHAVTGSDEAAKSGQPRFFVHLWRPEDFERVVLPALRGDPVPFTYGWRK